MKTKEEIEQVRDLYERYVVKDDRIKGYLEALEWVLEEK